MFSGGLTDSTCGPNCNYTKKAMTHIAATALCPAKPPLQKLPLWFFHTIPQQRAGPQVIGFQHCQNVKTNFAVCISPFRGMYLRGKVAAGSQESCVPSQEPLLPTPHPSQPPPLWWTQEHTLHKANQKQKARQRGFFFFFLSNISPLFLILLHAFKLRSASQIQVSLLHQAAFKDISN